MLSGARTRTQPSGDSGAASPSGSNMPVTPGALRRRQVGSSTPSTPPPVAGAASSRGNSDAGSASQLSALGSAHLLLNGRESPSEYEAPERPTYTGNAAEDEDDYDHERERELELRARVHSLQRQLEGLQMATATLQAVVNHTGAANDAAPSAAQQESRAIGRRTEPGTLSSAGGQAEEADEEEDVEEEEVHPHVTCDGCGAGPPLFGQVMKCTTCDDFDLCARCHQERDGLGHPLHHRFVPRSAASMENSAMPLLQGGQGPMASMLLRLLETELLFEAFRRSEEPDDIEQETQEDKEMRSAEVLSTLDRIRYASSSDLCQADGLLTSACEECALCLEEYATGEEVLKLPCRHLFHEGCLGPWFTKSLTCPMCKQEVTTPDT